MNAPHPNDPANAHAGRRFRRAALAVLVLGGLAAALVPLLDQGEVAPAPRPAEPAERAPAADRAPAPPLAVRAPTLPAAPREEIAPLPRAIVEQMKNRANMLHGNVVDDVTGEPVTKFIVFCAPAGRGDVEQFAQDPRNGRLFPNTLGTFTYHDLQPGRYDLLFRRAEFEPKVVRDVAIPMTGELVVRMSPGALVQGQVVTAEGVDPDGDGDTGIGGLEVRLEPLALDDPSRAPDVQLQVTDDRGRFRFSNLPPGTYRVRLANEFPGVQASADFYLGVGRSYPVTFVVPDQNDVTFVVRGRDGEPLNEAYVRLWPRDPAARGTGIFSEVTDENGEALLEFVPAGAYTLKVWKANYLRVVQDFELTTPSGAHSFALTLDPSPFDERNPTLEQIERLERGELPEDVFRKPP